MKLDRETHLTLGILEAIDTRSDLTQRHLSDQLGVALGLTNAYLRRCLRKGLIKITQAPANRYLYYLTPSGFTEKSRLTAEYLLSSLDYYQRAAASLAACFATCAANGQCRVLFAGRSEIAEIGSAKAHDFEVEVLGTFDRWSEVGRFLGKPVWVDLSLVPPFDAIIFTALSRPAQLYQILRAVTPSLPIHIPEIIRPLLRNGVLVDEAATQVPT